MGQRLNHLRLFGKSRDIGFHFGTVEQANDERFVGGAYKESSRIVPAYIVIQNPIQMADLNTWNPQRMIGELERIADTGDYPKLTPEAVSKIEDERSAAF